MSSQELASNNNQVPEGYKKTEVGVIPEDWEVKQIHQIIEVDPENLTSKTDPDYEFKYISLEDVDNGCLCNYSNQIFSQAPSRARRILRYQDILFATVRPNLKSHLFFDKNESDWICSTGFAVLRCKENQSASGFIFAYLFSRAITAQIETLISGSNYPAINSNDVKQLKILLPPLPEQKAIAQTLSDVDALIAALDKLIAKKRHIKTATMQQLLTGKTRLPGFGDGKGYKKSEVGVIPEDWELKAIKELNFDISDGNYSSKYPTSNEFKITGVPFIRANNIGQMTVIDDDMRFISVDKHSQLLKGHLRKNDILITTRGDIGQIALVPDRHINSNINAQIVRINTKDSQIYSIYFAYFLLQDTIQKIIKNMQTGSALKQLPVSRLTTLAVAIPPLPEQKAIAQVLSDIDSEITALEKRRAKTQAIKQGMMQELLTGKTRLINN